MNQTAHLSGIATIAGTAIERFQQTSLELLAAPGGGFLMAAAIVGILIVLFDTLGLLYRVCRKVTSGRRPAPTPGARVRGLMKLGAAPAEVARAVGLSRDALALVVPDEFSRGVRPVDEPPAVRERAAGLPRRRLLSA